MPYQPPVARAECTIHLNADGLDQLHSFLEDTWLDLRSRKLVDSESEFALTLMLGELVANAAQHAYPDLPDDARLLRVRLEATASGIRGEVRDRGREFQDAQERLQAAKVDTDDTFLESGRGLRILTSLADTVRYERTASGENVWSISRSASTGTGEIIH
jgi:anti-sigma regulatory factor (Ser/Thr protein kinase)